MPYYLCRMAAEDGRISRRSASAASAADCRRRFEAEGFCVLSVRRDWRKLNISLGGDRKLQGPRLHHLQPGARGPGPGRLPRAALGRDHLRPDQERGPGGHPQAGRVRDPPGQVPERGLYALRGALLQDLHRRAHGRRDERRPGRDARPVHPVRQDHRPDPNPGPSGPDLPDHAAPVLDRSPDHHPELRPAELRRLLRRLRRRAPPADHDAGRLRPLRADILVHLGLLTAVPSWPSCRCAATRARCCGSSGRKCASPWASSSSWSPASRPSTAP